ncbi:MAG: MarR family winged helix-turn-helix transcriptional regulator [Actinomycetota bacterium]
MSTVEQDAARLQDVFPGLVRALGLLRPDTTPCGQPMSPTEAHAIDELRHRGPLTQKDLASALGLQKSTVSRLVDQLDARELVARVANPSDARSVHIVLTPNGQRRAERLASARQAFFKQLLEPLGVDDRQTVIHGLSILQEVARARS